MKKTIKKAIYIIGLVFVFPMISIFLNKEDKVVDVVKIVLADVPVNNNVQDYYGDSSSLGGGCDGAGSDGGSGCDGSW